MRLADYFDALYVVNLPDRTDRRREMERELDRAGLRDKAEFFPAIRPTEVGDWPSLGAHGCFRSHLGVLSRARDAGLDNVLVMEDDLEIDDRLPQHEHRLVELLREREWGMAYLGHPVAIDRPLDDLGFVPLERPITTAHFYAVSGPTLGPLVDHLELFASRPRGHPEGGRMHVDGAYNRFREQHADVVALLAAPSFGGQRSSRSDISASWFDRVPGLRSAAHQARRLRRTLATRGAG